MTLVEARSAAQDLEIEESHRMEMILGLVHAYRRNLDWDLIPEETSLIEHPGVNVYLFLSDP
jgi:hypothetical protein